MSYTKRAVTVERREEHRLLQCDGHGCGAVQDPMADGEVVSAPGWYRLTKTAQSSHTGHIEYAGYEWESDACSHSCLLRIIQSLEVTS